MDNCKLDKELPPLEDPWRLPESIEEFKEWHYRALRRLKNNPVNKRFSGKLSIEIDYDKFVNIVQRFGLIEIASYEEAIIARKNDELKSILRENGFKVSGKKEELVNRILENISENDVRKSRYYSDIFILTSKGESLIAASYIKLKNENLEFFKNAMILIMQDRLDEAFRVICKKRAEEPFSASIGVGIGTFENKYPSLGNNSMWTMWYYEGMDKEDKDAYVKEMKKSQNRYVSATIVYSHMSAEPIGVVQRYLQEIYDVGRLGELKTKSSILSVERNFNRYECADIKKYQYICTLDLKTCPICAKLDGKIFLVSKRKVGVNCPPMHEECRCTTISVVDEKYMSEMTRTFRDPITFKSVEVPRNMSYAEWYDKYVKGKEEMIYFDK